MSQGITRRLLGQVLLISVLLACVAAALQLHAVYRAGLQALNHSLDQLADTHVPSLAASVWQMEDGLVRHQLQGISRLPDVQSVRLEGDLPFAPQALLRPQRTSWPADWQRTITRSYPLVRPGAEPADSPAALGTLVVEVSLLGLHQRLLDTALGILVAELVRSAALVVVLFLGVRRLILRPLQQVANYAGGLTIDRLDQALQVQRPASAGHDEIAVLADAINGMRGSLQEQIAARQAADAQAQQLEIDKQKAELASVVKSEFLANVSHEIRTPMNAIIGMTDLALNAGLPEPQRAYMHRVRTSAQLLLGMLNDLLDMAKIESGHMDIEAVPFALDDIMQGVNDMFEPMVHRKGLGLSWAAAPGVPMVLLGDPLRLQQVLLNLVGNAVKFTLRGQITVTVARLPDVPYAAPQGGTVSLRWEVRDSGPGMTAEQVARLFQPYVQAEASTARRFGGTGLGLAISRQLVERMGGRIGVNSLPHEGSAFWFELPMQVPGTDQAGHEAAAGDASAHRLVPSTCGVSLAGLRVLVADDNEVNQELARAVLERAGASVTLAGDGHEVLALLDKEDFDCVLMDCQMPRLDGYATTQVIRARPERAGLPILALTAHTAAEERAKVLACGMNDHLVKPLSGDELCRKVVAWTRAAEPTA